MYGDMMMYPNAYPTFYNQQKRQEVIRVHGREGATAYPLEPNSSVILMDETQPVVWLKTTDAASYPTLTGYKITPLEAAPVSETYSLVDIKQHMDQKLEEIADRFAAIERKIDGNKSDAQSNRFKQSVASGSRANQRNDTDN